MRRGFWTMGLRRFEKLRNRRQREFESKLLTLATPKPKNRFLAFINAPFTLWLLSAVVLGFGSVYYTAYKQCIMDGTKLSEDYMLYRTEMTVNDMVHLARNRNSSNRTRIFILQIAATG